MAIRMQTPVEAAAQHIADRIQRARRVIAREMRHAAEDAVNTARQRGTYHDQTGNLRSSVAYAVVEDGRVAATSHAQAVRATGTDGKREGEDYAKQAAAAVPQRNAIVLVAGMPYAAHVANMGYDVMDSAEAQLRKELPANLAAAGFKIK